ncbi:MAG: zinc ribbon domain-containing protein [Bacillota bacterium]
MFTNKVSRTWLIVGGGLGITLVSLAFFIPSWNLLLLILGFSFILVSLLMAQFTFAWALYKEEEASRQASMTHCPNCNNPVYKDDRVCPYCHEELSK